MSAWDAVLSAAGFVGDPTDAPDAWETAGFVDPAFDVLADVVSEGMRVAGVVPLDAFALPFDDDVDDLFDDVTVGGRGVAGEAVAPLAPTDDVSPDDAEAYTMTGDVVGLDADPDSFASVLDALGELDPPALDAWAADAGSPDGRDDGPDASDDVDDGLDDPGDWHLPR